MSDQSDEPLNTGYRFTDSSLVRPAITRFWFARLFPLIPAWLAANILTLLSTGSLLAVLVLSLDPERWSPSLLAIVFLIAMQVYVAGDHLDGMQAVATGTTSPLGDFLDHYCDLWAGGILVFGFWTLLGTAGREALFFMHACLILGFAVTYAERETRRTLHFTRYGTLEAIVVLTAFFLSWAIPGARSWWQLPMLAGWPWYTLVGATGAAMALSAVAIILRRMGAIPLPVAVFTIGLASLAYLCAIRADIQPVEGWLVMALYGAVYVARVMHGHLVPGTRSWPDRFATIAIVTLATWTIAIDPAFASLRTAVLVLCAYLSVSAVYALVRIIGSLRRYWVWVNASRATAT